MELKAASRSLTGWGLGGCVSGRPASNAGDSNLARFISQGPPGDRDSTEELHGRNERKGRSPGGSCLDSRRCPRRTLRPGLPLAVTSLACLPLRSCRGHLRLSTRPPHGEPHCSACERRPLCSPDPPPVFPPHAGTQSSWLQDLAVLPRPAARGT